MKRRANIVREFGLEIWNVWVFARRCFYLIFRRSHVLRMVEARKGTCGAHGCCNIYLWHKLFFRRCTDPADRTRCRKWNNLPELCRLYPFDEKDKGPRTRGCCNFYWDDAPPPR